MPKGYVALDGASLTVCDVDDVRGCFTVMLIAYTQRHVALPRKELGARVNVEVDVMAKYAERAGAALTARVAELEGQVARLSAALAGRAAAGDASAAGEPP